MKLGTSRGWDEPSFVNWSPLPWSLVLFGCSDQYSRGFVLSLVGVGHADNTGKVSKTNDVAVALHRASVRALMRGDVWDGDQYPAPCVEDYAFRVKSDALRGHSQQVPRWGIEGAPSEKRAAVSALVSTYVHGSPPVT